MRQRTGSRTGTSQSGYKLVSNRLGKVMVKKQNTLSPKNGYTASVNLTDIRDLNTYFTNNKQIHN